MAGFLEITQRDIDRSKLVTPNWYRIRIDAVNSAPSKNSDSMNHTIEGTIICDWMDDTTFAGVPTPYLNFNTKAAGFAIPFLEACDIEVGAGKRYDMGALAGKELEAFIGNGDYNGRTVNQMGNQFRKVGAGRS